MSADPVMTLEDAMSAARALDAGPAAPKTHAELFNAMNAAMAHRTAIYNSTASTETAKAAAHAAFMDARAALLACERGLVPMVPAIPTSVATTSGVKLISAATIKPRAIDWLWDAHLARGKLSILAGVPGTGKSTVAFNLAAIVSIGGAWPDGSRCPGAGNVLMWSGEDDPTDTIVPRLMAAGANLSNIQIITGGKTNDGISLPFDPARDVPLLRNEINRIGGAVLMIIDPIISAVAGDMHKANDVRRGLQAIIDLGAEFGCAVIGISHFSKGSRGTSPQERVIGSQAFAALARLVLVCAKDEDGNTHVLMRAKSNISLDHGGFHYSIVPVTVPDPANAARPIKTTKVEWGIALDGNARDVLSDMESEPDKRDDKTAACVEAMRPILCGIDGRPVEVSSTVVQDKLSAAGHSEKVIGTARARLLVNVRIEGFGKDRKSYWSLPTNSMRIGPPFAGVISDPL
jgi:putative DNA primase/helicase